MFGGVESKMMSEEETGFGMEGVRVGESGRERWVVGAEGGRMEKHGVCVFFSA